MKMKLGAIDKLEKLSYENYELLLKKELPSFVDQIDPIEYMLISGSVLPWKDGSTSDETPMLYLGDTDKWIKWIRAQKNVDLDDYSYGVCRVTLANDKAQVALLPEKGKLTTPTNLKAIQRVFKTMKPKVFFEVVEELESIEAQEEPTSQSDVPARPMQLALALIKRHQQLVQVLQQLKTATDPPLVAEANVNRQKLVALLRQLLPEWQTLVVVPNVDTSTDDLLAKGQQLYDYWMKQLKLAVDEPAPVEAPLQETYHQQLTEWQELIDSVIAEAGAPSRIEQYIDGLAKDVHQWEKEAIPKAALATAQQTLAKLQTDWATIKEAYAHWQQLYLQVEEDSENVALLKALEDANNTIQQTL